MDTRDKRSSAIQTGLPWRGLFPTPDGSLNQGDRQHTCNLYRGIAAGAAVSDTIIAGSVRLGDHANHTATVGDATVHTVHITDHAQHSVTVGDKDGA